MSNKQGPTGEQFSAYSEAYDYFNDIFWKGVLPPCLLTFGRKPKSKGWFALRWSRKGSDRTTHEIALNPDYLREIRDAMSTLVHEMCHLWQHECGTASAGGYHNKEWGQMMIRVGLVPSKTGREGGAQVGTHMDHYIVEGGPFADAFEAMPDPIKFPWVAMVQLAKPPATKSKDKVKYTCACDKKARKAFWAKEDLKAVRCDDCGELFAPPDKEPAAEAEDEGAL